MSGERWMPSFGQLALHAADSAIQDLQVPLSEPNWARVQGNYH